MSCSSMSKHMFTIGYKIMSSAARSHLSANQKKEMGYTIANQEKKTYLLYLGEI